MLKRLAILSFTWCVISVPTHAQQAPNSHAEADVRVVSTPPKDRYDKAEFWINVALAVVGGIGVAIGIRTLLLLRTQTAQIKRQADQMERQLGLQEVAFKQWVEIGSWKNTTPRLRPTATEPGVILSFEVVNATQFPFTLKRVAPKTAGQTSTVSNMKHLIPPKDAYVAYCAFDISPAELELYRVHKLTAIIEIETEIRDVLQKDCDPQRFQQTVTFGPNRCEAAEYRPHWGVKISLLPKPD